MRAVKNIILLSAAAALVAATTPVSATLVGYNTDPGGVLWDRGQSGTAWASFDTFATSTFSDRAPETSFGFSSPDLSQSQTITSPGGVTGGGDRIYTHFSPTSFLLDLETTFIAKTVVLQIKEHNGTAFNTAWVPTLNGLAFDSKTVTSFAEGSFNQNIYTYRWTTSLAGNTLNTLDIAWGNVGVATGSFDGLQVDAAAIPEPGVVGLITAAGMFVLLRRFFPRRA
jgi:hypothetical protein